MTSVRVASSRSMIVFAMLMALLVPILVYFDTARSIVAIWNSSETFAHGYIILPISMWLIWNRRKTWGAMSPAPCWPALLLLAVCGFGWLLAELGDVQVVRQYAMVAMIPIVAIALLGVRIAWTMAFPLFFLMFAVPFGDIFIAPLIEFTADFTIAALQMTGIPVLRNGTTFEIPSGNWSVVEACSGVRYLIASVTLGSLYAYLTYRSRVRQALFVLLSIIVPIIANGLRAYMIVMIGHLSGMQLAVGVDHLIYGWVFFGIVMFIMFWIGSYWRQDQDVLPTKPSADKSAKKSKAGPASAKSIIVMAVGAAACLAVWPYYANFLDRVGANPNAVELSGFQSPWQEATPFTDWKPDFFPANAELYRSFEHGEQKVGVSVLYYRNRHRGTGLISSSNRLTQEENPHWQSVSATGRTESVNARPLAIREARLQGANGSLLVWHWYWIDGKFMTSDYVGKLLQAKEKFLMRGDDGAALMIFSPYANNPEEARKAMREFLTQNLPSLEATLASNKKQ